MWACTPTSSNPGSSSSAATAWAAAPEATEKPNLESSPPVRMNSCVWASTPGVTRTNTRGRSGRPVGASRRRPSRAISSNESTTMRPTPLARRGAPIPLPTCCCRAGPASQGAPRPRAPRGAHLLMPHRGACPLRRPDGPWPGRGMPWRRRPPPPPRPRRRPGRPGGDGTRRRRRAGVPNSAARSSRSISPTRRCPSGSTVAVRGSSCRSTGALANSSSVGMATQDTAAAARGGTPSSASRVRSSPARAPVAQRIEHRPPEPVAQVRVLPGALFGGSSDSGGLRFPRATQRRS